MTTSTDTEISLISARSLAALHRSMAWSNLWSLLVLRLLRFYRSHYFIIMCILVLFLLNQFSFALLEVPRVRLFEQVICKQHFRRTQMGGHYKSATDVGQLDCKTDEVQKELATIIGIKTAADAIPGRLYSDSSTHKECSSFRLDDRSIFRFPGR